MRGASSSENSIQGQDRPSGDGTDSYQQALRHRARHGRGGRCPAIPDAPVAKPGFLEQLKARLDKTPPQVTSSKCLGQAINCLASNWLKLIRYIERGDTCPSTTTLPSGRATFSCTYDQSVARLLPLCHAYPRRSIDGLCAPEHSFPEGRLGTYLHVLSRRSCV